MRENTGRVWIKYRPEYEPSGPMSLQGHSFFTTHFHFFTTHFHFFTKHFLTKCVVNLEVRSKKVEVRKETMKCVQNNEVRSKILEVRSEPSGPSSALKAHILYLIVCISSNRLV